MFEKNNAHLAPKAITAFQPPYVLDELDNRLIEVGNELDQLLFGLNQPDPLGFSKSFSLFLDELYIGSGQTFEQGWENKHLSKDSTKELVEISIGLIVHFKDQINVLVSNSLSTRNSSQWDDYLSTINEKLLYMSQLARILQILSEERKGLSESLFSLISKMQNTVLTTQDQGQEIGSIQGFSSLANDLPDVLREVSNYNNVSLSDVTKDNLSLTKGFRLNGERIKGKNLNYWLKYRIKISSRLMADLKWRLKLLPFFIHAKLHASSYLRFLNTINEVFLVLDSSKGKLGKVTFRPRKNITIAA